MTVVGWAYLGHDQLLDAFGILLHAFHNVLGPHVGGHDQNGVLEGDHAPLAVGHPPIVQNLQQDVEHIGVSLLHLVKEDDCIRSPPAWSAASWMQSDAAVHGMHQVTT